MARHHFSLPLVPCRTVAKEHLFVFEQNCVVRGRGRFDNFLKPALRKRPQTDPVFQTLQIKTTKTIDVSKKF